MEQQGFERALIVLDMTNEKAHQNGLRYEPSVREIIPYIQGELDYFRQRMRPVIFSMSRTLFCHDEPIDVVEFNDKIVSELSPRSYEIYMNKKGYNAFFKTELATSLARLGVKSLTLVGAFTHTSVLTTTAAALELGFSVVVPETCVCSPDPQDHTAALRVIRAWSSK